MPACEDTEDESGRGSNTRHAGEVDGPCVDAGGVAQAPVCSTCVGHNPKVKFQEKWPIALDLLDRSLPGLPHGWITGDDDFGRASEFRAKLRLRREGYILDVPGNTPVRVRERRRPPRKRAGVGRKREVPFQRADVW